MKPPDGEKRTVVVVDEPGELTASPVEPLDTETVAAVPVKATLCGEPLALSVIVSAPVLVPATVGVKVTEIVQFAPAANAEGQALVSAKSPVAAMEILASAAVPEFVSVTVCTELVVLIGCEPKVRMTGASVA